MSEPLNPPPPSPPPEDVAEFVRRERQSPGPPAGMQEQILTRVLGTVGLPVADLAGLGPSDQGHPGVPAHPAPGDVIKGASVASARPLLRTVVAFVLGSGVGAGVHQALDVRAQRRAAPAAQPSRPPTPSSVQESPSPPLTPPPVAPVEARPAPARVNAQRGPLVERRERDRDLAAERGLIEQARTALARGKGDVALVALQRHARTFPHGALEEERESLLVQALVGAERRDEARRAGTRFHRRFPRSIFAPVVEDALRSIP